MWAPRYFASRYFAPRFFAGAGAALGEMLAAGDLQTAWAKWLDTVAVPKNEEIRRRLSTHYGVSGASDVSTLIARFLRDRQ